MSDDLLHMYCVQCSDGKIQIMINEILGAIISTVLGLGVFYVCWRYLQVPMYFQSGSYITTSGGTMTGSFDFGTSDTLTIAGNNMSNMKLSSACTTDYLQCYNSTVPNTSEVSLD